MAKKRKAVDKNPKKSYLQEYNFEITVILLLSLGIFLLIENLEIKYYLALFIRNIILGIIGIIEFVRDKIIFIIKKIEVSDFVGILFILSAIYLITNRWRDRMVHRYSLSITCPKCEKKLHRTRKTIKQKLLSLIFFLKVKNYRCNSCSFKGFKLEKNN